eukprot:m.360544 g.360544  ORF g.360544 m.360544 type:complete len:178 (-) comp20770_c0_seq5:558-1091(-)
MMTNHHGQSLLPHKYSSRTTADSLMLRICLLSGILTFGISEVGGHPGSRVRRGGSATSAPVDCGSDRHGRSQCVCVPTGECKRCDAFELALETESDDTNWCTATGYKQLVHCVDADDHESDTYQSCAMEGTNRRVFFTFEAVCVVFGTIFAVAASKRKRLLYERIQKRLQQQIEDSL